MPTLERGDMPDHSSPRILSVPLATTRPEASAATVAASLPVMLAPKRAPLHRIIGVVAKLAISAGLIWLFFRNIDLTGVAQRFVGQSPARLIAAGFTTLGPVPLAALRWQQILRALGIDIPSRAVLSVTYISSFFNSWLLGNGSG